jgi:hypothetical protein
MARGRVAIGLSVHTGWAACVVAGGSLRAPRIEAREEIELLGDPDRFVFHDAAKLDRADAARSVAEATKRAAAKARAEVARVIAAAKEAGLDVVACAVVANAAPMPGPLDAVLAAHPKIHAAEGCLYRDALAHAAEEAGLATRIVPPKQLASRAAKGARATEEEVTHLLADAGKAAGRPWAKDQRDAALGAWIALAG